MRKWPENDKPAVFEEIAIDICSAIRFAYKINRKNKNKDIPWSGVDIGRCSMNLSPEEQFRAGSLANSLEEQGRDALTEIVGVALRLGIEQGRRISAPEIKTLNNLCKVYESLHSDRSKSSISEIE
jgi:hypothetical protein